jgi:hypothetical protein
MKRVASILVMTWKDIVEIVTGYGRRLIVFGVPMLLVVAVILVLLWISGWWPEKLIPWLPFERV